MAKQLRERQPRERGGWLRTTYCLIIHTTRQHQLRCPLARHGLHISRFRVERMANKSNETIGRQDALDKLANVVDHEQVKDDLRNLQTQLAFGLLQLLKEQTERLMS